MKTVATAQAPASVANVAVGFDVLGFSMDHLFDQVQAERVDSHKPEVVIETIESPFQLSKDPMKNTAGRAVISMIEMGHLSFSVKLQIKKGIPLSSGLGGSAASAVAAVRAVNELLPKPLSTEQLLFHAIQGEAVASGSTHGDNVLPSLVGGLCAIFSHDSKNPRWKSLPVPSGLWAAVVHPDFELATSKSRGVLKKDVSMENFVKQSANLAAFVSACYDDNKTMLAQCLRDLVIEPQRQALIPGFLTAQKKCLDNHALGCSIAGAGPSVFAWCLNQECAQKCAEHMKSAFAEQGMSSQSYVLSLPSGGSRLL